MTEQIGLLWIAKQKHGLYNKVELPKTHKSSWEHECHEVHLGKSQIQKTHKTTTPSPFKSTKALTVMEKMQNIVFMK